MNDLKKNKKTILICILFVFLAILFLVYIKVRDGINNYEKNLDVEYLRKYEVNEFTPLYVDDNDMASKYLNDFKNNMLFDQEEAWNSLNKEYRSIRFGDINKYKEYLKEEVSILTYYMEVDKYSIDYVNGNKIFYIYDKNDNLYIIKEKSIMNYEVYLDEDTVRID